VQDRDDDHREKPELDVAKRRARAVE
jgi:hypothetical protein